MATMDRTDPKKQREWYSVPLTTVLLVGILVVGVLGVLVYPRLGLNSIEKQAERAIDEATERIASVELREDVDQVKKEHGSAWDLLAEANTDFEKGNFERALENGDRCLLVLDSIERSGEGTIRVLTVQGGVEYRRGERGAWKRLRNHVNLNPGDWVKTSTDGTAELLYSLDGSLFTLRQSTMVHLGGDLGGGDEATNLNFGSVELNTSNRDHILTTPKSEATISPESEALVAFDPHRQAGRFAAFTGGVEVTAKATGKKTRISALQQVEQFGERLSEVASLPGEPPLAGPSDDHEVDLASESEVVLSWQPVKNARHYALSVSGNRLFASHLIEDRRLKTSARIGVQREGQFYWRVAAMDGEGNLGPWSDVRSFRATSASQVDQIRDNEPPPLTVSRESYGNIVIVSGQTELGATVKINGDPVVLKSDGSFRMTIQMTKGGWNEIEVVATDAWENSTSETIRVFVDAV